MNGLIKAALRISSIKNIGLVNPVRQRITSGSILGTTKRQFTRTLWHMCSRPTQNAENFEWKLTNPSTTLCSCGCGIHRVHTKGEKELAEFLNEEIQTERKMSKIKSIPTEVAGFQVKLDGSEVTLTKKGADETISVNFNVNHTVDADAETEPNPNSKDGDAVVMKSTPNFEVDIQRGSKTLSFTCSFVSEPPEDTPPDQDGYSDIFGIDEITMFEGEWNEKVYAVAGDVLDGYLYDLLMNLLEEKGISNEFAEKLSELSTSYEHTAYIALLENLQKFTAGK